MKTALTLPRTLRTLLGLAAGSWLSTTICFPVLSWNDLDFATVSLSSQMLLSTLGSLFVFVLALPVCIVGHAALYALKRHAVWYYLAIAALAGVVFSMFFASDLGVPFNLYTRLEYALGSALCALIAWLIRRPDKDTPAVCLVPTA